jgi:hypothetical protein
MSAPPVPKPIVPPRLASGMAIKDQLSAAADAPRRSEKGTVTMPIELLVAVRTEPEKLVSAMSSSALA